MKRKVFRSVLVTAFVLALACSVEAQMQSENYGITTSVFSGDGGTMSSSNYQTESTLGQPSPLMDPADPPESVNYYLYPGFWFTLDALLVGCDLPDFAAVFGLAGTISPCDSEGDDGDIDGADLAEFAANY